MSNTSRIRRNKNAERTKGNYDLYIEVELDSFMTALSNEKDISPEGVESILKTFHKNVRNIIKKRGDSKGKYDVMGSGLRARLIKTAFALHVQNQNTIIQEYQNFFKFDRDPKVTVGALMSCCEKGRVSVEMLEYVLSKDIFWPYIHNPIIIKQYLFLTVNPSEFDKNFLKEKTEKFIKEFNLMKDEFLEICQTSEEALKLDSRKLLSNHGLNLKNVKVVEYFQLLENIKTFFKISGATDKTFGKKVEVYIVSPDIIVDEMRVDPRNKIYYLDKLFSLNQGNGDIKNALLEALTEYDSELAQYWKDLDCKRDAYLSPIEFDSYPRTPYPREGCFSDCWPDKSIHLIMGNNALDALINKVATIDNNYIQYFYATETPFSYFDFKTYSYFEVSRLSVFQLVLEGVYYVIDVKLVGHEKVSALLESYFANINIPKICFSPELYKNLLCHFEVIKSMKNPRNLYFLYNILSKLHTQECKSSPIQEFAKHYMKVFKDANQIQCFHKNVDYDRMSRQVASGTDDVHIPDDILRMVNSAITQGMSALDFPKAIFLCLNQEFDNDLLTNCEWQRRPLLDTMQAYLSIEMSAMVQSIQNIQEYLHKNPLHNDTVFQEMNTIFCGADDL
uniref:3'-5' exonuclease domain-containing protein n=1 Tax=Rhabditophanes sp. KR3021 TaxID=114890 RepID=A0AC35TLN8_9BILA